MKIYTIIGGVNGVGKSSLSGTLAAERNDLGIIIDTDKITSELGEGKISGGKAAISQITECLEKGINFTQETTLSGKRTLKTICAARERDYYIRLYYIGIGSAEESLKRIKNRVEKGGHDIPQEDVLRRYESRFRDLAEILPYCNEARFYDNENGFVEKAEYKNGSFFIKSSSVPQWLAELQKYIV